jgi:hypothetical protein
MLERGFEILVRTCHEAIFGLGWSLRAQQLSVARGRIDLLFANADGELQLVELKKGQAKTGALNQALKYARCLSVATGTPVTPWVVAHEVPSSVCEKAAALGVCVKSLPLSRCEELMEKHGIDETTLIGPRLDVGVLNGGGAKRRVPNPVDNVVALSEMPAEVAKALGELSSRSGAELMSGRMQTVIHYKGVKLGGVNRKHRGGLAYIASGVINSAKAKDRLAELGFKLMTKTQSNHEHVWWELSWTYVPAFVTAINEACDRIDSAFTVGQTARNLDTTTLSLSLK